MNSMQNANQSKALFTLDSPYPETKWYHTRRVMFFSYSNTQLTDFTLRPVISADAQSTILDLLCKYVSSILQVTFLACRSFDYSRRI